MYFLLSYPSAAYDYPIYGTQWHPEKNAFEWTKPYIPHSPTAVKITFYMAQFFVNEGKNAASFSFKLIFLVSSCTVQSLRSVNLSLFSLSTARKNFHSFETAEEENNALIYNYDPTYTGPKSVFEQQYYF